MWPWPIQNESQTQLNINNTGLSNPIPLENDALSPERLATWSQNIKNSTSMLHHTRDRPVYCVHQRVCAVCWAGARTLVGVSVGGRAASQTHPGFHRLNSQCLLGDPSCLAAPPKFAISYFFTKHPLIFAWTLTPAQFPNLSWGLNQTCHRKLNVFKVIIESAHLWLASGHPAGRMGGK